MLYDFGSAVGGFQFEVSGLALVSASGGAAEAAGFTQYADGDEVVGLSFTGATIPAGSGVLTTLTFSDVTAGTTELSLGWDGAVTSSAGVSFATDASGSLDHGDPDCAGDYYSSVVVDQCGVCGGDDSSCDDGCGPNEPGPSGCDNTCLLYTSDAADE